MNRRSFLLGLIGCAVGAATAKPEKIAQALGVAANNGLFGIDASTYELWRSGAVGGPLTREMLLNALADVREMLGRDAPPLRFYSSSALSS